MKGLEDLFFTSGNSLEAISLERESTVVDIDIVDIDMGLKQVCMTI